MIYLKRREIQLYNWIANHSVGGVFNIGDYTPKRLAKELDIGVSTLYLNLNGLCDKGFLEWGLRSGKIRIIKTSR
jgi:hypothetical protein|nr:MAG TPA: winged helix-turn-helix domain protein [Caudoviricetes sp.]